MRRLACVSILSIFYVSMGVVGCGSSSAGSNGTGGNGTAGGSSSGGGGGTSSGGGGGTSSGGGGGTSSGGGGGTAAGGGGGTSSGGGTGTGAGKLPSAFGTYIEIGDSISDKGGAGPFFYDLLYQNDDTTYPTWAGLDLKDKFSVATHLHAAVAGSQTKDLVGQISGLPATLTGPVLVTITSGGNDLRAAAQQAIAGTDQTYLTAMGTNIDAALTALTASGRFGAGVEVYVLYADIYDPTDNTGNFNSCGLPLSLFNSPNAPAIFGRWNAVIDTESAKYPNVFVEPLHDDFLGHGIVDSVNWFYTDCIHPDTAGHHQLRRLMWKALTGADGPS
jgi:lysophospholipase L1-like esterase